MKNRDIANRIAELHYPNEPNVIHDQKYRLVRMKTLADQVESELNLLTIPVVSQRSKLFVLFADWLQYNGKWMLPKEQVKEFFKQQKETK